MDTKPWYLSKTIWASLVTILSALAGLFGFRFSTIDSAATAEMLLQAVTALSGLVAIFGRLSADTKIG
ncbi:MAG: hypothetical protein KDJ74_00270 [Notoacmeibacter sp.]|nr:hypothetical protein [Notoacmeibacter sp.]